MNVALFVLRNRFLIQLIGLGVMRIQLFSTTTNYGHSIGLTVSKNLQRLQNRNRANTKKVYDLLLGWMN